MAELDSMDLGLNLTKKKKKKKGGPVDMGIEGLKELAISDSQAPVTQPASTSEVTVATTTGDGGATAQQPVAEDDDKELAELLGMKKKKKKQKPPPTMQDVSLLAKETHAPAPMEVDAEAPQKGEKDASDDFELPKKKKKLRPNITFETSLVEILAAEEETAGDEDTAEAATADDGEGNFHEAQPWEDTDRDYTYEELLERVFNIIKLSNPNYASGQRRKLVMKPPQVVRVGAKKTSFVNFTEICRLLHRQPKHLMNFLLVELGTSASLDGTQQLIIKGKFQQKQIETVLRRYIKEYVTCHTCRSPETNLEKETRLFFLQCETCGSRCSVQNIKSGFQAVTGKRAQIRSKGQ